MTATVPSRIQPQVEFRSGTQQSERRQQSDHSQRSHQNASQSTRHNFGYSHSAGNRIAVLWFPDWPVQAALLEETRRGISPESPAIALASNHRITACCDKARAQGVRRGMKLRAAQALCPSMVVRDADPQRDGRLFSSIVEELDDVSASLEVLRPGMVALNLTAATRFYGSEQAALERFIDAAAHEGIDATAGAADELPTAIIAARHRVLGAVVQPGDSVAFLYQQPLSVLLAEPALGCQKDTVETLAGLGISTLGELTELPTTAISTRFGSAGLHCHRIASAQQQRKVAPGAVELDLSASITPEAPITRVDEAAFIARMLADQVHQQLATQGLNCVRIKIAAETDDGTTISKIWRTTTALTEHATAERVRGQLDGWLSSGGAGAIVELSLTPLETQIPTNTGSIIEADTAVAEETTATVVSRLQSMLGFDAVQQPHAVGGRGVAERVRFCPMGRLQKIFGNLAGAVQNGSVPSPRHYQRDWAAGWTTPPAECAWWINTETRFCHRRGTIECRSRRHVLGKKKFQVLGWSVPWPVDTGWWESEISDESQRLARMQLVGKNAGDQHPKAWLLVWQHRAWRIEAMY